VLEHHPAWDFSGPVPLYEQAADWINQLRDDGELAAGTRLPAERDLAHQWGIAYQTVRRVMRELRERGVVISRQGRGTFIIARDTRSP
jgi:DNA-binding GntR family transcriptional regulator